MFGIIPFKTNSLDNKGSFDNFFDEFFNDSFAAPRSMQNSKFSTDIIEKDNAYEINAELPGVKKEDIKLDFKNNYLVIGAKRKENLDEKKENYIRKECSYGDFSRSFYFDNIDQEKIRAKFENGILKVTLPKEVKKEDSVTKIEIQ